MKHVAPILFSPIFVGSVYKEIGITKILWIFGGGGWTGFFILILLFLG
jgi:hypothetical protein